MTGATPRPLASRAGAGPGAGRPSRRRIVLGAAATLASLSTLAGCGWRLDLPQPPPPVPTRRPAPDEKFLLGVVAELRSLVAAADAVPPGGDRRTALRETRTILDRERVVLTGRLTNGGVPSSVIAAASGTVGTSTVAGLADDLASVAPARWQSLAAAGEATRDLVLSAWAARLACAQRLGASVEPMATPSTARPAIAAHTAPLVYAFEVVAAQSDGRRRSVALDTLSKLRALDLAVAGDGGPTPGGWSLPFPVTTAAEAQRLGDAVLRSAVDAVVDVAGPDPDAASLEDTARWSAHVQVIATGWGMPLAPFPGSKHVSYDPMYDLIPAMFAHTVSGYEPDGHASGEDWIDDLPGLIGSLLREWELEPVGRASSGVCAVAIPVRLLGAGRDVVGADGEGILKISWPHPEAATEHLALQGWNGHGAVRLVRADPSRFALLLERLHPRDLTDVDIDDACAVIGDLLGVLRRPAHPRVPSLTAYAERKAEQLRAATAVLPRRYLDQAAALAMELTEPGATEVRLLHTDLHYTNVLAADRAPWLAIDPKPMAGDVAFEVAPALWNRAGELGTGAEVRWSLRRRLEIICERAGVDEGRARAWTIVREADNAVDAARAGEGMAAHDRVSLAVTIIKAMND